MVLTTEIVVAGLGAAATVGGGAWGFLKWLDLKFVKKADSTETAALWKENTERKRIDEKLFEYHKEHEDKDNDRFERTERANRDRHDELLAQIVEMNSANREAFENHRGENREAMHDLRDAVHVLALKVEAKK